MSCCSLENRITSCWSRFTCSNTHIVMYYIMMRHRKEKENLFVWQVNGQDDDERKEDESGHHSEMETDGLADEFSS